VQVISTEVGTNTNEDLRIAPNPATEFLRIQRSQGTAAVITVYDAQGRSVMIDRTSDTTYNLDLSSFKPGMYVVRISTGNGVQSARFVKE
jgi:hypothetical protein